METNTLAGLAGATAVINASVAALKKLGVSSRYLPALSLVIGGAVGLVSSLFGIANLWDAAVTGIIAGAVASGVYDLTKKTILNK